jgi:hypothetical protein
MAKPTVNKMHQRIYFALRVVAVLIAITSGVVQLTSSLRTPSLIYATKDLDTYPLTITPAGELGQPAVETKLLVGHTIKVLGLLIQNKGKKTATDVFVRIPFVESDGFVGGWIARGDRPITSSMQSEVKEFKYDKLVPEESVCFYIYLKNTASNLADRVQVVDGDGRIATYMPYVPMRRDGRRLLFSIPLWAIAIAAIVVLLSIPDAVKGLDKLRDWLIK